MQGADIGGVRLNADNGTTHRSIIGIEAVADIIGEASTLGMARFHIIGLIRVRVDRHTGPNVFLSNFDISLMQMRGDEQVSDFTARLPAGIDSPLGY